MQNTIRFVSIFILVFVNYFISPGQIVTDTIPGEYYLQGIMETTSAVLLKPDNTFEIYYSNGAVDRQGSGRWKTKNDKIILNSRPWPKTDFKLVQSKSTGNDFTTIQILTGNQQILSYFEVMIRTADGEKKGSTDSEGIFHIPKVKASKIELLFTLCPERHSTIPISSEDNFFELKAEPWIAEIFLDNVVLTVSKDGLTGEHPLLNGNEFMYTKSR